MCVGDACFILCTHLKQSTCSKISLQRGDIDTSRSILNINLMYNVSLLNNLMYNVSIKLSKLPEDGRMKILVLAMCYT